MNAKEEFLQHIQRFVKSSVLCAHIKFGEGWPTTNGPKDYYTLTTGYTQE